MARSILDQLLDEIFDYAESSVAEMHEFMLSSIETLNYEERKAARAAYNDMRSEDQRLEAQFGVSFQ